MTAATALTADEERRKAVVASLVLDAINGSDVIVAPGKAKTSRNGAILRKASTGELAGKIVTSGGFATKTAAATDRLDVDVIVTLSHTDNVMVRIQQAIDGAWAEIEQLQVAVDPGVAPIAAIVERTLPAARAQLSEANIERLVGLLVETQDPLAAVNGEIDAANARARHGFIEDVPTLSAEEVNRNAGSKARNLAQTASRWKAEKKIFAVPFQGKDRYPAFQFKDGRPLPAIARILAALPDEMSQWETAFWFVSSNGWLDDEAPADCLKSSEAVIEAARHEGEDIVG